MSRVDRYTASQKQLTVYADFTNNLDVNPVTGLLARVVNEEAIKQSLRNLIMTSLFERPYQPFTGSKIRASLFEMNDPTVINTIRSTLDSTLRQEPRATIQDIQVVPNFDNRQVIILIQFSSVNIPNKIFTLNISLDLIR